MVGTSELEGSAMQLVETVAALREARSRYPRLGLVPTMGYLHEGHLSLVRRAKQECGAVAVSIFVNPTQFGAGEDFARYPRSLQRDLELLDGVHTDLVFTPAGNESYPEEACGAGGIHLKRESPLPRPAPSRLLFR